MCQNNTESSSLVEHQNLTVAVSEQASRHSKNHSDTERIVYLKGKSAEKVQKVVGETRFDLINSENKNKVQCFAEIWGQGQTELNDSKKITNCSGAENFKGLKGMLGRKGTSKK